MRSDKRRKEQILKPPIAKAWAVPPNCPPFMGKEIMKKKRKKKKSKKTNKNNTGWVLIPSHFKKSISDGTAKNINYQVYI